MDSKGFTELVDQYEILELCIQHNENVHLGPEVDTMLQNHAFLL